MNYRRWKIWLRTVLVVLCLTIAAAVNAQQGGLTRYVYDDNGRLRAVISPNGEAAIYEYDPAGNITAIRRNAAGALELLGFSPIEGMPGTQVTIFGTGLGGGVTAVAFNGTAAQIVSVNAPVVTVTVPDGATTGPITVTTSQGSATTARPFVIKGIKVTPQAAGLNPGQTAQFSAMVFPAGENQSVTWSVNDVDGGNATFGTISGAGLYTAPTGSLFSAITVRAKSVADPNLFEDAQVMVGPTDTATAIAVIGASVLVQRQPVPESTAVAAIGVGVVTTTGPYISAISPNQIARGASMTVIISGANLTGVNTIRFSNGSGGLDANITASNISINPSGTSLTATVTASASAALGSRLVVVSTATGNSAAYVNGVNSVEIVP